MSFVDDAKSLYAHAVQNNYIMPACHMFGDMGALRAILDAAEEEDSPVIVQVMGYLDERYCPIPSFLEYFRAVCGEYAVPILMNYDHMQEVDACVRAIDQGHRSVMYDGSHLSLEENTANTKRVVEYAHRRGAWVEAELGSIPGYEGADMDVFSETTVYTDPRKAAAFIDETGCDSLAVAVGTAHGGVDNGGDFLTIDYDLLERIREAVGPDYPLVLHGAAQLPRHLIDEINRYGGAVEYLDMCSEEAIEKTRHYGVAKANMDVDNWLVVTGSIRRHFVERPNVYNYRIYNEIAMDAMKEYVQHKMKDVTKSSGFGSKYYSSVR